ncbi:zinc finger homeobox protein 3-like [Uloborus diversus]|uniref:zinc finger homeobox protein 3-like n=1 Tax=Uloborus diversus TaxID=327109 RepID=UPI002409A3CB|nr:zinc finger homeobox protein 3-like [Uloborus diversus]XP_054716560.1 zinc finger homeobox protein 3-like [Uloborus diversus]
MDTDVPNVDTGQQQHIKQESTQQGSSADQLFQKQHHRLQVVGAGEMTPEEGQEVVADLQQQTRVPERPSSSSRTPCPKFTKKCDSCGREFHTTNHYLEHVCGASPHAGLSCSTTTTSLEGGGNSRPCSVPTSHYPSAGVGATTSNSSNLFCNELSNSSTSDVENFTGKIVYNPDGSAFILETQGADSEISDDEGCSEVMLAKAAEEAAARVPVSSQLIPHMVNALHIARNPALYSALYGQAYSFLQEKNKVPDIPVMHSFRVFTVRNVACETAVTTTSSKLDEDGSQKRPSHVNNANFPMVDYSSVPIKPILMCFLCKLSFGYAKSFVAHAMGEHNINLNEEEKNIMSQKNTSAIIQGVGKEKEPLLSFLEPIPSSVSQNSMGSQSGNIYAQSLQSSCTSSFGSTDPMTNLLNAVSSAVAGGYGSSAITTLVSAVSSPVAALSEIKPSVSKAAMRSTPSLTSSLLTAESDEALAPEFQDLVTIEKLAKAATAAAEADSVSSVSPRERKTPCYNGQNNDLQEDQDLRLNPFDFSPHPTLPSAGSMSSLDRPTSAGSHESMSPGMSRVSPKNNPAQSPLLSTVPSPSPTTSSPVCICPQHPDGRTNGVECPKCDLILGSSRSLGGHMTMMHSRNSCKTLKCPKCNWHYKYQETLEIHMKEKHPENDMSCIYCLTNQSHPRLARGETYTCGYKPYRCEVCNYSTTTKGNLSIHMQSDKHINNVQELQNGTLQPEHVIPQQTLAAPPPMPTPPAVEVAVKKPVTTNKPKATWRCDVCNYETNVARNLRIHMTSEKHNHNMMVLQQNVKHMQQISAFQQAQAQAQVQAQAMDPMFNFHPGLLLPCDSQLQPEAALADMAYNHALLMMATQQQQQRAMAAAAAAAAAATGKSSIGAPLNLSVPPTLDIDHPDPSLRPDVPYDENGKLFQCCVCHVYSADSIEALNQHAQLDRTRQREEEVLMVVAGTYICKLCTYKTNLKANFQLHCKTDKHLQRLQHVNHVKEGGASTEWKLKYANVSNPVQVRCNACDYYTNSIHKLQLHNANPRHEANGRIFAHLQIGVNSLKAEAHYFHCRLCNFSTKAKFNLIQHVHSIRHLRHENFRQMQLRTEGRDVDEDVRDYVLVKELKGNEKIIFDADVDTPMVDFSEDEAPKSDDKPISPKSEDKSSDSRLKKALLEQSKPNSPSESASNQEPTHRCPFCNYTSNTEVRIQMHVVSQHLPQTNTIPCPLCQEGCKDIGALESHLMEIHNVTKEGVQRLLLMVDMSDIENKTGSQQPKTKSEDPVVSKRETPEPDGKTSPDSKERSLEDLVDDTTCSFCNKSFLNVDDLFTHQNEFGHMDLKPTPTGLEYQCWKKGCLQYFKTINAVQLHFKETHSKKPLLAVSDRHVYKYRCNQCSLAFKTLEKLQLHSQYHMIRAATKCVLCGRSFRSVIALQKHVETTHTDMTKDQLEQYKASLANNPLLSSAGGGVLDPQTTELLKKESIREDMEIMDDLMDVGADKESSPSHETDCDHLEAGEQIMLEGTGNNQDVLEDYINSQSMAEDSYNDPNRKYKCHRCKVAFTRQSYLTSHNKTLLHRKGEKMSYPMEKYLDPNRPFKCDICMESFTQKNILLVHYNSVSHLHKVKLSMKENNNVTTTSISAANSSSAISTAGFTATSSSPSVCSSSNSSVVNDSEKKPFKCNICKVAYSQGSTLDIHVRSVLHQTRASKLHELAMTGQIDLTAPLIERSEQSNEQLSQIVIQQPTMTSESSSLMLPQTSQVSGTSASVPSSVQAPKIPDLTQVPLSFPASSAVATITSASPQLHLSTDAAASMAQTLGLTPPVPQPPVLLPSQVSTQALVNCSRCNAIFTTHDSLLQHQQLCCFFNPPASQANSVKSSSMTSSATSQPPPPPTPFPNNQQLSGRLASSNEKDDLQKAALSFQPLADVTNNTTPPQLSPQINQLANQLPIRPRCPFPRPRPLVYKHLIESFGFDVVMQFNENNQRRRKSEKKESEENCLKENVNKTLDLSKPEVKSEEPNEKTDIVSKSEDEIKDTKPDLPEINRSVCHICTKEFTSIWVLKTHREEIHKEIVPFEFLEKFADIFRQDYDNRNADQLQLQTCEDNLTDTNPPTPNINCETPLCPTPSSISSTNPQLSSTTPPASSASSQISDVPASVTANQMAAQLQLNQFIMSMGLGMGLPMGMNLNMPFAAAAAMNLHPPLIPVLLPPTMDPLMASAFNHPMMSGGVESNYFAAQQKMLQHQQQQSAAAAAAAAAQAQQQKRARTRINDEQLKILRTYFDINNSPTEEQLIEMSEKSGLPLKVIKHWFRNTLFKERQRNKDSPYNFNNPPSTFLNLEEYEKTGEAKVIPINRNDFLSKIDADSTNQSEDGRSIADDTDSSQEDKDKHEPNDYHSHVIEEKISTPKAEVPLPMLPVSTSSVLSHSLTHSTPIDMMNTNKDDSPKDLHIMHSESSSSSPQPSINFSSITSMTGPIIPNASASPPTSDSPRGFNSPSYCGSSSVGGGTGSGKRANRTRFTDYQIKVLQEFFESNAYPKDDDLEYLSKLLSLSPRVIVVWFQNARQKARKVYENQPPINTDDDSAGKFQRTPGLNYQCKKCLQVFQRYYELIKHQKSSCFKDENPIAVQMKAATAIMDEKSQGSSVSDTSSITNRTPDKFGQNGTYRCDKCSLSFPRFDLWREHQIVHIMNPNLFPNYSPNSSFGILQYEAQQPPTPPLKRKLSEEEEMKDLGDQPKDKRLRTTILPEQLDYLYQKYQIESNPSRKMLENIAREVGLKKRVVQVWFQNTRARERKGQFRAHQQVIHKRCPFCRALFKARSALESHLATRHADQYTRGDINIDSLPDGEIDSNPETPSASNASEDVKNNLYPSFSSCTTTAGSTASFTTQNLESVQSSMKKYYEDSLKKYLDELSSANKEGNTSPVADLSMKQPKPSEDKPPGQVGDTPLDLSKPVKVTIDGEKSSDGAPTNLSDKSSEDAMNRSYMSCDDARSETHSESTENMDFEDHMDISHGSNPTSPSSSGHQGSGGSKRFRTQMSTIQLKVMKSIFADYKTPSMAECETLGRDIGLPKRVVQVWFQNARAKEKKAKLAFMKAFGHEMDMPKGPEECSICKIKYNIKFSNTSMQDHLFSRRHLENLKAHITKIKKLTEGQDNIDRLDQSPVTPNNMLNQLVHSQHSMHPEDTDLNASPGTNQPSLMQQLHMMGLQQMPGMSVPMGLPGFPNSSNGPTNMIGLNAAGSPPTSSMSSITAQSTKTDAKSAPLSNKCNNSASESPDLKTSSDLQRQSPATFAASQGQQRKEDKKDVSDVMNGSTTSNSATNALPPSQRVGNMTDFPMPTTEAGGLLPYMYAGFPGYYAGLSGAFFHPGMYPGRNKL